MFDSFYLDGVAPPQGFGKGFLMEFSGQPSFLTSGELWASVDSGETQTLAAWKDGYVLRENPDGSMTAEPKFTSGIPPLTIRRVPTMGAENRTFHSPNDPNVIAHTHTCHGGHRGKMGYFITFTDPKPHPEDGIMSSRGGYFTLSDAIAEATSGERSNSTSYIINSYWERDSATASGQPKIHESVRGYFGPQEDREANYCDEPEGHKTEDYDPNDCASENRAVNDDDTCGDCLSDYSEDTDGDCIADETGDENGDEEEKGTNWLLWGGIAAVGAIIFIM